MAIYCYKCKKCGKEFEVVKPIKQYNKEEKCHECGIPAIKQINTGVGVIFKGDGFYQTDYKNKEN